jgi:uncharacterized protein YndB with AHSA1/START domain
MKTKAAKPQSKAPPPERYQKEIKMAVEKDNVVVVEHEFAAPVEKVFGALKLGRLFFNCGAWPEKTQIDFRKGGKYLLDWAHYGQTYGEFTEIIENKHIAFTWNSDDMEIKGTQVLIDLVASPKGCKVKLRHEGFTDLETAKSHEGGWTGGLDGVDKETTQFHVRFEREFVAPVEMLYEACSGMNFFSHMGATQQNSKIDFRVGGKYDCKLEKGEIRGEFLEIEKNKKIVFTWLGTPCGMKLDKPTTVTMEFGPWGDGGKNSYLELTHEGSANNEQALSHHEGWNWIILSLYKKVCR